MARINVLAVVQAGRLQYEALLFAASLRLFNPETEVTLYLAEPQPGPRWPEDPRISDPHLRERLRALGARIVPFVSTHFGQSYPYGNKIEALSVLPEGEPFIFFDTDTLITGRLADIPFDFDRPTASLRREPTWPVQYLYGPSLREIWGSLYDLMGLDLQSATDPAFPPSYWQHYPYYNAGFFFYRCPTMFGARFLETALTIDRNPPPALNEQPRRPWLDQIALPLVIHALGGGKGTIPQGMLDGSHSWHYRALPLLYACAPDATVMVLESLAFEPENRVILRDYLPFRRMIYRERGKDVRALFDRSALPRTEAEIRQKIKAAHLWMR